MPVAVTSMPEVSPSVLIIRLDAIGDALALTPLLAALRRRAIPVDIVLRPSNAGIFAARAARHVVTATFELRSSATTESRAPSKPSAERCARASTRTCWSRPRIPAAIGSPARSRAPRPHRLHERLGQAAQEPLVARLLTQRVYRSAGLDPRAPHECEVLFRLCRAVDRRRTADARRVRSCGRSCSKASRQPDDRIADADHREVGAARASRSSGVVDLVRRLAGNGALHLLSRAKRGRVRRASRASDRPARSSYFDDTASWKAAIGAAPAIVAPDSGALHVAGMIGTPVVAVFPPERDFALQVARWAPWAAPHRIVRAGRDWPARAADALVQIAFPLKR